MKLILMMLLVAWLSLGLWSMFAWTDEGGDLRPPPVEHVYGVTHE